MASSFAFNLLTEPATYTTTNVPSGFNAIVAWLLGQCCAITYQDYDQDSPPDFSGLTLGSGVTFSANFAQGFTASEANGPGSTPLVDPGDYSTFPAGFGVVLSIGNPPAGVPSQLIVIALRGTRTWEEWFQDSEAYPVFFAGGNSNFPTLALAHAGFYALYSVGSLGATVQSPLDPNAANRASGAIAQQVASFFANSAIPGNLPVYVTGHSLGGALAAYCAWDIQAILKPAMSSISMYSLAAPRCVMGAAVKLGVSLPIPVDSFLQGYQGAVPNSFRIVHTCDIVPILPPTTIVNSDTLQLYSAHVTDAWSYAGQSGGLTQNVVAFAAQTYDLGNNHSCVLTYLPFLAALAGNF